MPIQPSEFCDVAAELQQRRANLLAEPMSRTAIGRAYYAAYLATREVVRSVYGLRHFDVRHTDLAAALKRSSDPDVSDVGTRLQMLLSMRTRADYQPNGTLSRNDAALMIATSRHVLKKLPGIRGRIPPGIPPK
jgi:hypothetical protein